jgi:hypothetical protein
VTCVSWLGAVIVVWISTYYNTRICPPDRTYGRASATLAERGVRAGRQSLDHHLESHHTDGDARNNEWRPPLADDVERASERAVEVGEARALHELSLDRLARGPPARRGHFLTAARSPGGAPVNPTPGPKLRCNR